MFFMDRRKARIKLLRSVIYTICCGHSCIIQKSCPCRIYIKSVPCAFHAKTSSVLAALLDL
jgi:hypothetical protein